MLEAILIGLIAFAIAFPGLMLVEKIIHKLTHNPDRSYRWGVWTFSILIALYALVTNLGR